MKYDPDNSLGYIVDNISRYLRYHLNKKFNAAGSEATAEQWQILARLWHKDGQTQRQLAKSIDKDETCISRLINGLEKRNLVVRIPDSNDRRRKKIHLTPKGKISEKKMTQLAKKNLIEAEKGISPNEMAICEDVLHRILKNIKG